MHWEMLLPYQWCANPNPDSNPDLELFGLDLDSDSTLEFKDLDLDSRKPWVDSNPDSRFHDYFYDQLDSILDSDLKQLDSDLD